MAAVDIQNNIAMVQDQIANAARRAGRSPSDVTLVAVSKTHDLDAVAAAYEAGLRHFGENRVGEAHEKIKRADEGALPDDVVWHMVGHIQSRKTSDVAPIFDWAHSIDRHKIARRLSTHLEELDRSLDVLIEVNISGQESKYGFDMADWPGGATADAQAERFFGDVERMLKLPHLNFRGLMTLAPYTTEPETVRPLFRRLRQLRETLNERYPQVDWAHLSMGMSADYPVAVEEGATLVRIGTAIFGERDY